MTSFGLRPANLLEMIFEQVSMAVLIVDNERRIVYVNDPAAKVFGIPRSKLASYSRFEELARDFRAFDSSGTELPFERLAVVRTLAGERVDPHEMRVVLPDGALKWLHVTAHQFSVMGMSGVLVVATDETAKVELEHIAANMQRVEVLGAMAGALAHNFNNIISVINLSALVCLESPDLGPDVRARLQQISEASRHAAELTRRLAQFSRTQELKLRPASINKVVEDVLTLMEALTTGKISLITKLHPGLPDVDIDPVEMQQVLVNLILNARDAMPQGGELVVGTGLAEPPRGTSSGSEEDRQWVTMTVSDTGSGIPETIVDRIFEPFFTTKRDGTGLGLASAHGIVRQHNGDIRVESTVGMGTQFTVYLPPSPRNARRVDGSVQKTSD
jgi:PAS domain S-box-containing protein